MEREPLPRWIFWTLFLATVLVLHQELFGQGVYLFRATADPAEAESKSYSRFSGVCVGRVDQVSVILTCGHCVPAPVRTVEIDKDGWQPVTIRTRQQPGPDLALLESPLPLEYFPLADSAPAEGTAVWGMGHRFGGPVNKWTGAIASRNSDDTWNLSHSIRPGDSGGAVLSRGELVGVLCSSDVDRRGEFIENGQSQCVQWSACRNLLIDTYGQIPGQTPAQSPEPAPQPVPGGKPVVLVFTADWCGACRDFWRDLNSPLSTFGEQVNALVEIVAVPEGDPRAKQYNVSAIPTFILASDPSARFTGHDRCTLTRLKRLVAGAKPAVPQTPEPQPQVPDLGEPAPFQPSPPLDLEPVRAELEKLRAELEKARLRIETLEQEPIRLTIKYNDGKSFSETYPHGTPIVLDFSEPPEEQPAPMP